LKQKEIEETILVQHEQSVSKFINTALNQDIELRVRFSDYFSKVSDEKYKPGWQDYNKFLNEKRENIRNDILAKESRLYLLKSTPGTLSVPQQIEEAELERRLKWDIAEVGYAPPNISVTVAPNVASPVADTLWLIVHEQCVAHQEAGQGPKPCESVDLSNGEQAGVAILKDLNGVAQMLAIPTRRITGIEDPQMLAPDAPNVFAAAWKAKALIEARLPHTLPREDVAIAINSKWSRSQNQFHLHVDCLAKNVADALARNHTTIDETWRKMTIPLNGRVYLARWLDSVGFSDAEPLRLLADGVVGAKVRMGDYSLAAVGATFDGKPGFILLADSFSLDGGGHAEDIQDHDCAIARSAP